MSRLAIVLIAALVALAGCRSTTGTAEQPGAAVEDRTTAPGPSSKPIDTPPVAKVTPTPGGGDAGFDVLKDPKNILSRRSIYFEFDSYVVKDEFRPLIEAHARFLLANQKMKMLIQGNTDERGSREYNIALGQRRADAVKNMLQLLGVKDSQLEAVSLGEEKPRDEGHDERAWSENRRTDMLYSGEY